ncbi:MAG: GH3 auxin-responsive promoter family protein [Saprospiraceae bacterium]|nr:GH3 auxin-responsive promoter family protein [Saprospiraceae bacterium]
MKIKSHIIRLAARKIAAKMNDWSKTALDDQRRILEMLIRKAAKTEFGVNHSFDKIKNYDDFKKYVPVRDYEGLKDYFDILTTGKKDVLWPGKPKYFAKTSGTTSGIKYIPITDDSMPNHIHTARTALLNYIHQSGNASIFDGKMIFLSGSPELEMKGGIKTGRLSGIVNHEIPTWVRTNQLPSYETNCIDDWESKLDKIVLETVHQDMRLISGIPPWVQMYYEKILEVTGKKTVKEVFPNYSLFMYGGVNFEPYRAKLEALVGSRIDSIETYPASEGFIAFQNDFRDKSLLLNTNSGIFFEFIPVEEAFNAHPVRLSLSEVEIGKDYALVISNNAGLWGYDIGDCVRFVSINPYKLIVTGRIKHYISAFGEHVIGKEVEEALLKVASKFSANIIEFTVAPQVSPPEGGTPYHEWFIEFDNIPENLAGFSKEVDDEMCRQNIYYKDLIDGKILQCLKIRVLKNDSFRNFMKTQGKLGGQNKVPRLSNDRKIADALLEYVI